MIWDILYVLIGLIVGIIVGFLIARKVMTKELMKGMGRTPNQKQVNQLMKQMSKFN